MKQKILYILVIITVLLGGNGEVWAQEGYKYVTKSDIPSFTVSGTGFKDKVQEKKRLVLSNTTEINANAKPSVTFTIGDNIKEYQISGRIQPYYNNVTNTVSWSVPKMYYISLKSFSVKMDCSLGTAWNTGGYVTLTAGNKSVKSGNLYSNKSDVTIDGISLGNSNTISMTNTRNGGIDVYFYIYSVSYTYTLSYYELDLTALDKAISDANDALSTITDETMKEYLNAAIATANDKTFRNECTFPNSFWYKNNNNEVSEGIRKPFEVGAKADKLIAVTKYLLARTAANMYAETDVPNAVYNKLHPYDDLNPNDYTTDEVNGATAEINTAIELAEKTTEVYKKVKADIAIAAARTDHNDATTLAEDVDKATTTLENATTTDAIEKALKEIKDFDEISFINSQNEIQEGSTLANPALADSRKVITYESSDNTIIEIDGTTLKALKPGKVTITATTTTDDKYYGYTTTKEFTVTPKAVILYPNVECTIVPNIVYPEITLERSFSAKTHYTLTLPFDSNISDIDGDYAAQLALVTYNNADGYTLYFQKVAEGDMMANQPYIVYAENGFKESLKWVNITVAETIEAKEVNNDRTQGWTMQGNYTPGFPMAGNYGIAGGKFCLGTDGSTINAYTAYFIPPTHSHGTKNVRARVAVIDEGGNTTYIGELSDLNGNAPEEVFGIDGMRLPEMRKGINIVRQKDGSVRKIVK